ncbi:DUF6493 family protein [Streptomyces sp. NPDC050504]|uniref:DUF7824 domain-containing protein n=1 Tax=Streptomyces sp. NPDC050504 TaxID=3365618 RepID=UPI0037964797
MDAVRAGRAGEVPGLLKPLSPADRKACLAELKALQKEVREWDWNRWDERGKVQRALLLAGAGCHTGAAAAAAWIGGRNLRGWQAPPAPLLLDILGGRDAAWLADVAHRLASRTATASADYPLVSGLVRLAGCPVPTTDGHVIGWAETMDRVHGQRGRPGLLEMLRKSEDTRELAPRLLDTTELARSLVWSYREAGDTWPEALAVLAADGVLDRGVLIDRAVARLLRGGKQGELKFALRLLECLEPTADEERARVADWCALLSDAPSAVASRGQEALARLVERGEVTARQLAEVSDAVLFRTEKKLVRAQLVVLGKALRHSPDAADELLVSVAGAFGHEDTGIQERALKLAGRFLAGAGEETREEVAHAVGALSPMHRALAAELLGAALPPQPDEEEPPPYEELLPPAPEELRLDPAPASSAELVEEVAVLLKSRSVADVPTVERALDALVRHAYRDRKALVEALRPALSGVWWYEWDESPVQYLSHVDLVVAALIGRVSVPDLHRDRSRAPKTDACVHDSLDGVWSARVLEAAHTVLTRPVPCLLATPTWGSGALDPAELVERLRAYRQEGVEPVPVDFTQALLRMRVRPEDRAALAAQAAELGTRAGERLAAWLTSDEPPLAALRAEQEQPRALRSKWWRSGPLNALRTLMEPREQLVPQQGLPAVFRWVGRPIQPHQWHCSHWPNGSRRRWAAVLPGERETFASWMVPSIAQGWAESNDLLPAIAEAYGPAGPGVHLAVACGLGAPDAPGRLAAVDALLVLAARGDLDGALLGGSLTALLGQEVVKPNRLADSLRTAASTGAYGTVWSVLAELLPGLLTPGTAPRGLSDILSLAAECVEHCGAGGTVPGLAEVAGRSGRSLYVQQAQRLQAALRHGDGSRDGNGGDGNGGDGGSGDGQPAGQSAPELAQNG